MADNTAATDVTPASMVITSDLQSPIAAAIEKVNSGIIVAATPGTISAVDQNHAIGELASDGTTAAAPPAAVANTLNMGLISLLLIAAAVYYWGK